MMELNKIYNEDCFDGLKRIPDNSINLVITDPPYWHKKSICKTSNGNSKYANSELYDCEGYMMGEMSDFKEEEMERIMIELVRVCKIPNIYLFCSETQVPYYAMFAEKHNLRFSILIWEKPLSVINKNRYSQNVEFIVRVYDIGTGLNRLDENEIYNRVKRTKPVNGNNKLHVTQKPVALVQQFIRLSSKKGDVILDAFMGSGTTAIACIREERNYIGFEKNEKYFNVCTNRIKAEHQQLSLF